MELVLFATEYGEVQTYRWCHKQWRFWWQLIKMKMKAAWQEQNKDNGPMGDSKLSSKSDKDDGSMGGADTGQLELGEKDG